MKKRAFILLIAAMMGIFSGCFSKKPSDFEYKRAQEVKRVCSEYEIVATFDPYRNRVSGAQEVSYQNNSRDALEEVVFHLYPNAFKTYDTVPFPSSEMPRAYPKGFAPGYIIIERVFTEEEELEYWIEDTLLKVNLPSPLKPKGRITLGIYFSLLLPPSPGRYGYGDDTFNLGNWYPILAVHDEEGWHDYPYYKVGDPFYSDVSNYRVSIRAPREFTIAATGNLVERQEEGEEVWWTFKADLVRDFAWVSSPSFSVAQGQVGETRVSSYYLPGDEESGQKALDYAQKAIEFFGEYFGHYPYPDFKVVASDFYIGGMEYPQLVMIGREFYFPGDLLEYIVVHETAHQWWYGLVGSDQVKEPWLDEALTEYSTMLYYRHRYGEERFKEVYEEHIVLPYKLYEATAAPGAINRPLDEFDQWAEYSALVYCQGAMMLMELEEAIGRDKMQEVLRQYFKAGLYKNVTAEDFIEALDAVNGGAGGEYIYRELKAPRPLKTAS